MTVLLPPFLRAALVAAAVAGPVGLFVLGVQSVWSLWRGRRLDRSGGAR